MSIGLERVQEGDWDGLNRVIDRLRSLVLDTGGQSIGVRFGHVTLSWSSSTSAGNQVVAHGLGRTPENVQVTPRSMPFSSGVTVTCKEVSRDATDITINAEASSSVTGDVVVDWLVVG